MTQRSKAVRIRPDGVTLEKEREQKKRRCKRLSKAPAPERIVIDTWYVRRLRLSCGHVVEEQSSPYGSYGLRRGPERRRCKTCRERAVTAEERRLLLAGAPGVFVEFEINRGHYGNRRVYRSDVRGLAAAMRKAGFDKPTETAQRVVRELRHKHRRRTTPRQEGQRTFPANKWCRQCGKYPHEPSNNVGPRNSTFSMGTCRCGQTRTAGEMWGLQNRIRTPYKLAKKTSRNA